MRVARKEGTSADLGQELALWKDHVPAVILDEVQRLQAAKKPACNLVASHIPGVFALTTASLIHILEQGHWH